MSTKLEKSAPKVAIASLEALKIVGVDQLSIRLADEQTKTESLTLEHGKIIVILDGARPADKFKTLKKWVAHKTGIEVKSEAYKAAVSFSGMVDETAPTGAIKEAQWDAVPVRWHYLISAILNVLEKKHAEDDLLKTDTREQIAVVCRELPKNGFEQLKAIAKNFAPEPPQSSGGGGEPEPEPEPEPVKSFEDQLRELGKNFFQQVKACSDIKTLELATQIFEALKLTVESRIKDLTPKESTAAETPATEPAEAIAA